MHLTTLVNLLERDIGSTASARANLADLLAERGHHHDAVAQARVAQRLEKQGKGPVSEGGR